MKKILFTLLITLILLSACGKLANQPAPNETPVVSQIPANEPILEQAFLEDWIVLEEPLMNQKISSPLTVKGDARGNWFFEASFPVKLLDANGRELAVAPATSTEPWMTTEYIPFEVRLEFETPATDTGMLVLEKDNPSGLPENAAKLEVPVRFK